MISWLLAGATIGNLVQLGSTRMEDSATEARTAIEAAHARMDSAIVNGDLAGYRKFFAPHVVAVNPKTARASYESASNVQWVLKQGNLIGIHSTVKNLRLDGKDAIADTNWQATFRHSSKELDFTGKERWAYGHGGWEICEFTTFDQPSKAPHGGHRSQTAALRLSKESSNPGEEEENGEQAKPPVLPIDLGVMQKAMQHRDAMPPAPLNPPDQLGSFWSYVGPHNYKGGYASGRINAVAFDPNAPNRLYVGAPDGGVWASTDGGNTFTEQSDNWADPSISCIAVDPQNGQNVYAGTGDFHGLGGGFNFPGVGVVKSTNYGATWVNVSDGSPLSSTIVSALAIDPENTQIVIAAAPGVGVFRSTNGGGAWTKVLGSANWTSLSYGTLSLTFTRNLYVAGDGAHGSVYVSGDNGATWTQSTMPLSATSQYALLIAASRRANAPNTVYAFSPVDQKILESDNGGGTWKDDTGNFPLTNFFWDQAKYNFALAVSYLPESGGMEPSQDVLYVGMTTIWQGLAGGGEWHEIGDDVIDGQVVGHNDTHALVVSPFDPNTFFIGCDGGCYSQTLDVSTSNYSSSTYNETLQVTQFYDATVADDDPSYIVGSSQDNATPVSPGSLGSWTWQGGGDGYRSTIASGQHLVQICNSNFSGGQASLYYTTDNWQHFQNLPLPGQMANEPKFWGPLTPNVQNPHFIYTGSNFLYRLHTDTLQWDVHLGNQTLAGAKGWINAIAVSPTDEARIYTVSNNGQVWMTKSDGSLWEEIDLEGQSNGLPAGAEFNCIAVDPTDENDILVGIYQPGGEGGVWRCKNTDPSTGTSLVWEAVSGLGNVYTALPALSINSIVFDPIAASTTWYVANNAGVFYTNDGGGAYFNATAPAGLPNVVVNRLYIPYGSNTLYAATMGRGLWSATLTGPGTIKTLTLAENPVEGNTNTLATVTLGASTTGAGQPVYPACNSTMVSVTPPFAIPAGASSGTFSVIAGDPIWPITVPISATVGGTTLTKNLTVLGLLSYKLAPTTVEGGGPATGTITASTKQSSDLTILLSSSNTAVAKVPASVVIPAGQTTISFGVVTYGVSAQKSVNITASVSGVTDTIPLVVVPAPSFTGVSVSPTFAVGGYGATGTVTFASAAPLPTVIGLSSNSPAATVPSSVTVAQGSKSAIFGINTVPQGFNTIVTLTAKFLTTTKTTTLQVELPRLSAFSLNPTSVESGSSSTATVAIDGPAPPGGAILQVTSNVAAAKVPPTVTIPTGKSSVSFQVSASGVELTQVATITVEYNGGGLQSQLTLHPYVAQISKP